MKKAQIYVPWIIANNTFPVGLCMFSSSVEEGVVGKPLAPFAGVATYF